MPSIVFPVSSAPGATPQEGSGRLINCYAVKQEQGSRSPFKWSRSAGLREILNITGHSHCRGFVYIGSTLIVVLDERVYAVTLSGVTFSATNLGELAGTDTVTIARNYAGTPNIIAVCEAGTFNLFTGSAPTSFADGDLPAVTSCTTANGYLVFLTGSGEIWATALNAVTVESDAFQATQMTGRRVIYFRGELFVFGDKAIKVYEETGDDPFPFRFKKIEIPSGTCGTHAVAAGGRGATEGWIGELFWVGEDNIVYRLNGYSPEAVSNDDVTHAIANAADRTLIEISLYMDGKYAIVQISSPGEWTWEYNASTGLWNERESYGRTDNRARCSIYAFDRWIRGDADTGKLSSVDTTYLKEYNDALIFHLESGDNAMFPYRFAVGPAYFDFVAGQGNAAGEDPIETDPKAMLSWSLNGGATWGNELHRPLGAQGETNKLVKISNCGLTKAKGIRFRVRVSDPVNATFLGGRIGDEEMQRRAA